MPVIQDRLVNLVQVCSRMALSQVRPQAFTEVKINKDQVSKFFQDLKDRKLVRGENLTTYKITDAPLSSAGPIQNITGRDLGIPQKKRKTKSRATPKKEASVQKKAITKPKPASKKRKGYKLEKSVANSKL